MLKTYIDIARPDHWFKNIFMLPGVATAMIMVPHNIGDAWLPFLVGIISTCLIASANYVINEYLDREFDSYHPTKHTRPCAQGLANGKIVFIEYLLLSFAGLALAAWINNHFLIFSAILLVMGWLYNIPPVRMKDHAFLDVLCESVNNPLRFMLGWTIFSPMAMPPSSVLLAYWFGGAFLMSIKRFAEYRHIGNPELAGQYRASFKQYTGDKLLVSAFFYALNSSFFLAIFLVKYRVEFILTFPLFAVLFSWYLWIGLKEESRTQTPEKLYREWPYLLFVAFIGAAVAFLFFVDMPDLQLLLEKNVY